MERLVLAHNRSWRHKNALISISWSAWIQRTDLSAMVRIGQAVIMTASLLILQHQNVGTKVRGEKAKSRTAILTLANSSRRQV